MRIWRGRRREAGQKLRPARARRDGKPSSPVVVRVGILPSLRGCPACSSFWLPPSCRARRPISHRRRRRRPPRHERDSTTERHRDKKPPKRIAVTPEHLATAFRDGAARSILQLAREARTRQDSALRSYDATTYQRISAGLALTRLGRDRLAFRSEEADARALAARHRRLRRRHRLADRRPHRGQVGRRGDRRRHVARAVLPGQRDALDRREHDAEGRRREGSDRPSARRGRRGVLHLRERRLGDLPSSRRQDRSGCAS